MLTCEFNRARFQVLVLDPNLIPHSIDVVIGEFIYELHFRVEREELAQPIPIDMDDDMMEEREDEGTRCANDPKLMHQDPSHRESTRNSSAASSDVGCKKTQHGKSALYHISALEVLQEFDHEAEKEEDEVATGGEAPDSEPPSLIMHEVQMASILESETPGRRSKRRAETVDESSLERAERMKAAHNLDFKGNKEQSQSSLLILSNDVVMSNLGAVGFSLGQDQSSIASSVSNLRQVEIDRVLCKPKIDKIFDVEEKEEIENEEVDKLILNSLCSEIMEEVMDLGSAYPKDCNTTPISKASSTSTKRAKKRKNRKGKNSV
jgi:hypothetical protein